MKRSWNLVSGSWCYVFGTWFVCMVFSVGFHLVWQSIFALNAYTVTGSIMSSIPSLIVSPILAVMMTIMFMNLRVEKEGLDAQVFARELGAVAAYSSLTVEHFEDEPVEKNKQVSVSNAV